MIRYTTHEQALTIDGVDLTDCDVLVSYRQRIGGSTNRHTIDLEPDSVSYDEDEDETTLTVTLTQEQTAGFVAGYPVQVQANWIDENGERSATDVTNVRMSANLYEEVMEYDDE